MDILPIRKPLKTCELITHNSYIFAAAMTKPAKEVKPYQDEGPSKKEQVTQMFDNIAPHYDLLNRVLSAGIDRKWRKNAIAKLNLPSPGMALDVATGTGDLAFEIKKQYPDSTITGLDIAENMLNIARQKSSKRGFDESIDFVVGDSENLPFESNSFDAVSVAFGVRNFGDLNQGLREICRVLKPGGRLVVLEFTKPRVFPFKQLFGMYFKYILPRIGSLGSGDKKAYKYLYESVQAFPDYGDFTDRLEQTGFTNTSFKAQSLGICAIYTADKLS